MPVDNGVGYSLVTPDKQDSIRKMIQTHINITKAVMDKYPGWVDPTYIYIDAYSGDGIPRYGADPSPAVFMDCISSSNIKNYLAWFIDKEESNVENLKKLYVDPCLNIECGDNTTLVPAIARKYIKATSFGLLYLDPNNFTDVELLRNCSGLMPKIDFLIRMNCNGLKRAKKIRLSEVLAVSKKKTWLIRRPFPGDRWQWTTLFGTNYTDMKKWEKAGFYRIDDSDKGKSLYELYEYTAKEKKKLGLIVPKNKLIKSTQGTMLETYNLFEETK